MPRLMGQSVRRRLRGGREAEAIGQEGQGERDGGGAATQGGAVGEGQGVLVRGRLPVERGVPGAGTEPCPGQRASVGGRARQAAAPAA